MTHGSLSRYSVAIEAHEIPPRFSVPAQERIVYATDEALALADGIRAAHVRAELPPWKPLLRASVRYATATKAPLDPWEDDAHS